MRFEPLPVDVAAAVEAATADLGPFSRLRYCAETGSTNDLALELALAGEAEGTAVLADAQLAGRGRLGRSWHSPAEAGLYLSVVVRPPERAAVLTLLTLGAGVAAAAAVAETTGLMVELKWPNDLVVGRPWRKLGGILCEAATTGPRVRSMVIGYGINLHANRWPAELVDRTTALEAELGRAVDRAALVVAVLGRTRAVLRDLQAGRAAQVLEAWRLRGGLGLPGRTVTWQDQAHTRQGRAVDIDDDGALIVESAHGRERIVAGEVRWTDAPHGSDAR